MTTWQQRIKALRDAGMTLSQISTAIGLSIGGVGDLSAGRTMSPRADVGMRLYELHRKVVGEQAA